MKYAVIKTGGKQYRVSEGNVIEVDRLSEEPSGKVVFEDVLLLVNDGKIKIGNPTVTGEKISAKILENTQGDKIRVSKFKSKVRFRKVTGFRAKLSKVEIEKIGGSEKSEEKVTKKAAVTKKSSK